MTTSVKGNVVSEAQQAQFREEGYMILERLVPGDMLQMLRQECSYFLNDRAQWRATRKSSICNVLLDHVSKNPLICRSS